MNQLTLRTLGGAVAVAGMILALSFPRWGLQLGLTGIIIAAAGFERRVCWFLATTGVLLWLPFLVFRWMKLPLAPAWELGVIVVGWAIVSVISLSWLYRIVTSQTAHSLVKHPRHVTNEAER